MKNLNLYLWIIVLIGVFILILVFKMQTTELESNLEFSKRIWYLIVIQGIAWGKFWETYEKE